MNDFRAALKNEPHDHIPVWFMRQAGRYMDEYKELRKKYNIREMCMDPEITEKITYAPVKLLGVDAAIIFADIILPLEAMGYKIDFNTSGPKIENGYRNNKELKGIHEFDINKLKYRTYDSIQLFKTRHPETPIIGFSGGIITVLSYIIAGMSDNNLVYTKEIMLNDNSFKIMKNMIKNMVLDYVKMQINAGVDAIQIFDSWLGALSPYTFEKYVKDDIIEIVESIKSMVPVIYFSTGSSGIINEFNDIKPDILSVDWRIKLDGARRILNNETGLQGNLDPYLAQYNCDSAIMETQSIVEETNGMNNYIFNLGHGVLPETKPETLKKIAEFVHSYE
ncbi:uroporphyrinogen decarboxylase [Ferroplasma sp.]|uniref:uroporphyrinogen decarboxylase n=1 Tax=Ferroplasma sp. TaxID=2591003 RepID=UPI00307E1CF4